MHLHVIGDFPQDQRFHRVDPEVKKIPLKPDDTLGNPVDRLLPLLNALDQPGCRLDPLLYIFFPIFLLHASVHSAHDLPVEIADPESRKPLIVQNDLVIIATLEDIDIGNDRLDAFLIVNTPRMRIHLGDDHDSHQNVIEGDFQFPGDLGIILDFKILEMAKDHAFHQGTRIPHHLRLDEQALPKVAGGNPDGIEFLNLFQHPFHKGRRHLLLDGNLIQGGNQVAVLIQVADNLLANAAFILSKTGKKELPHQMVRKRCFRDQKIVPGRSGPLMPIVGDPHRPIVFQITVPVELLPAIPLACQFPRPLDRLALFPIAFLGLFGFDLFFGFGILIGDDLFQQRIFLHLLVDHVDQIQPRHLQKLDRLLKLRRHDQLLGQFQILS